MGPDTAEQTSSGQGWQQAAQPTQPPQPNAPDQTQSPDPSIQPTSPQTPQLPVPQQAMPLRPKRGGLLGVIDKMADAIVGTTTPEIYTDEQGNEYVQHHNMPRGQQWARIGAEFAHGAAAGLAGGRGAGNMGRGALAGWEAGAADQQKRNEAEQQMSEQVKKDMTDRANYQMLQMNLAAQAFKATRLGIEADQKDIEFSQNQLDRMIKPVDKGGLGGNLLGQAEHPGDLAGILGVEPKVFQKMIKDNTIQIVPIKGTDGHGGFAAVEIPKDQLATVLPNGSSFYTYDPVKHELKENKSTQPMTVREQLNLNAAAEGAHMNWLTTDAEQKLKGAQAGQAGAQQKNLEARTETENAMRQPDVRLKGAQADAAEANAEESRANAGKAGAETQTLQGGSPSVDGSSVVDVLGQGRATLSQLRFMMKNPTVMNEVAKKYPDFDGSKIEAYLHAQIAFTSGKPAIALNAGGTALDHMYELYQMNTPESMIPGTKAWGQYQTKVTTLASELAQFYGKSTDTEINKIISKLNPTLPYMRSSNIRTQAGSMIDKIGEFVQQWHNAAPSPVYQGKMPGLSGNAKHAWNFFDPKGAQKYEEELRPPAPMQEAGTQAQPQTQQFTEGSTTYNIPIAHIEEFKREHPNAR